MQIVQTTFGVFHHFELAHQLYRRGHLKKIYSTWPWARLKREGLPHEVVGTFPLLHTADYFLSRTRFYPQPIRDRVKAWNAESLDAWTRRVIRAEPHVDALIGLSGSSLLTGPMIQRRGGRFICDRGSTHHRFQEDTLREEYARWGVPHQGEAAGVVQRDEAIYDLADAITVPSSVAGRSYLKLGVPAEKVHVIPYGVRLERFQKQGEVPRDRFEVLFAGQVSVRKGVPYLLEAFRRLKVRGKRLRIAGSVQPHLRELMARMPQQMPVEDVEFLGPLPQDELIRLMSTSHMLVLPSVEEGLALVQAQAMACECPVIATEATGAEDLFTDGVEGFIVPDRDVDALAGRMQQLADDPALRDRMAAASLARVKTLGGWDEYGRRWDDLLHTLTGCKRDMGEA